MYKNLAACGCFASPATCFLPTFNYLTRFALRASGSAA